MSVEGEGHKEPLNFAGRNYSGLSMSCIMASAGRTLNLLTPIQSPALPMTGCLPLFGDILHPQSNPNPGLEQGRYKKLLHDYYNQPHCCFCQPWAASADQTAAGFLWKYKIQREYSSLRSLCCLSSAGVARKQPLQDGEWAGLCSSEPVLTHADSKLACACRL